jgi:hypothetical protein
MGNGRLALATSDVSLCQLSRKIIKAWTLLKQSKFDQLRMTLPFFVSPHGAKEILSNITYAICLNNEGSYHQALEILKICEEALLSLTEMDIVEPVSSIIDDNLFIIYLNLNRKNDYEMKLDLIKESSSKSRLLYFKTLYHAHFSCPTRARKMFQNLFKKRLHLTESQRVTLLITWFELSVKGQHQTDVFEALKRMSRLKKFSYSDNYKFMYILANYYFNNKPLYLYSRDFKRNSYLAKQVDILLALENVNLVKASENWNLMMENYPRLYLTNFKWGGEQCIFSLVVEKILSQMNNQKTVLHSLDSLSEMEKRLIEILSLTPRIGQAELYQQLYGREFENRKDLDKLSRLISRVRSKTNLPIKSSKGSYLIAS